MDILEIEQQYDKGGLRVRTEEIDKEVFAIFEAREAGYLSAKQVPRYYKLGGIFIDQRGTSMYYEEMRIRIAQKYLELESKIRAKKLENHWEISDLKF